MNGIVAYFGEDSNSEKCNNNKTNKKGLTQIPVDGVPVVLPGVILKYM